MPDPVANALWANCSAAGVVPDGTTCAAACQAGYTGGGFVSKCQLGVWGPATGSCTSAGPGAEGPSLTCAASIAPSPSKDKHLCLPRLQARTRLSFVVLQPPPGARASAQLQQLWRRAQSRPQRPVLRLRAAPACAPQLAARAAQTTSPGHPGRATRPAASRGGARAKPTARLASRALDTQARACRAAGAGQPATAAQSVRGSSRAEAGRGLAECVCAAVNRGGASRGCLPAATHWICSRAHMHAPCSIQRLSDCSPSSPPTLSRAARCEGSRRRRSPAQNQPTARHPPLSSQPTRCATSSWRRSLLRPGPSPCAS